MTDNKPDFLIITETWLKSKLSDSIRGVSIAQSKLWHNQGVAILCGTNVTNIQPLEPSLWSENIIVIKASIRSTRSPLIIIGYYAQPGTQLDC